MATRIALALLCALTTSFTPPTPRRTEVKLRKTRGAGGDLVDPDAGAPDDDAMTELRERMMQEELKQRKQTIKEGKGNRLSAQYVELLTAQHPSELVGAFYREADPECRSRSRTRSWACWGRCGGYRIYDDRLEDRGRRLPAPDDRLHAAERRVRLAPKMF